MYFIHALPSGKCLGILQPHEELLIPESLSHLVKFEHEDIHVRSVLWVLHPHLGNERLHTADTQHSCDVLGDGVLKKRSSK